ncbi:Pre-rRNA-processing protein ESF1 [Rhynchospora pubera]|uniref:Pre-rRNA-processing protein ESF1 n=1 Tax=Rhynchospora pubera TaxID=906938 RepID=A0AAV8H5Z5_9POAL|nr:Pre-rRNA-processing protein ESF1 [Rhynchospora pubera]
MGFIKFLRKPKIDLNTQLPFPSLSRRFFPSSPPLPANKKRRQKRRAYSVVAVLIELLSNQTQVIFHLSSSRQAAPAVAMAPSGVAEERRLKKNKAKDKGEERSKKSKKRNHEPEPVMEAHESLLHDPPKKKKKKNKDFKGASQFSKELKEYDENGDMSGAKKKKKNKRYEQQIAKSSEGEEEDAGGETITDGRFSAMRQDPLFRRMRRKENKVVIDSRFDKIFKDKNFAGSAAPVDKRGRPKKDEKGKRFLMQHYFNQEGESKEREAERDAKEDTEGEDEMGDRLGLDLSDSDDLSGSDESRSIDDGDEDDQYSVNSDIAHYLMANHDDTPTIKSETHRLAVVNLDWDHIKAVDLYVVMNSCLPKGGRILSVSVYPSEFGLKCMDIEATHGPSALLDMQDDDDDKVHDVDADGDEDDDTSDDDGDESDVDEEKINDKLRAYELNKLRYYYAVVVCDSSATADYLYQTLDGTEFLKTSNVFDLRFIADTMEFNHPHRDVATEAPVNYKEPDFETRALQHSKVKLTWEDEEPERKKVLRQKFNLDQLDELSVYLASTDESEDEDNEVDPEAKKQATREKFLSLLDTGNNSDSDKSEGRDKEGDMEITFNTDLEALGKKILERKGASEETVWESVLRRKKEKKKARKLSQSMQEDDDDLYDDHGDDYGSDEDDFFMEEPTEEKAKHKAQKKDKGKRREKDEETVAATQAELELLLAGDEDKKSEKKGYNMKRLKVKGKKGKKETDGVEEKFPDVDVRADPRFSALINSHDFALDPTDPQFKRTPAYLREKLKNPKKSGKREVRPIDSLENPGTEEVGQLSPKRTSSERHELSAAIRSIKKNLPKSKY